MTALAGLAFGLCVLASTLLHPFGVVSAASSSGDGSVLQALLESHYSEWMELVERAQMLHPLEQLVGLGDKLTIFAPQNHQLQPQMKSFLLKPSNSHLLRKMVEFHVLSQRITVAEWRDTTIASLATDSVVMRSVVESEGVKLWVGEAEVVAPDSIIRADGVVHGVNQMLLPLSVQQEYVTFSTRNLATPLPTGAPGLDTRRAVLLEHEYMIAKLVNEKIAFAPTSGPVSAPTPFGAPAPGPSLGPSGAPLFAFGDEEVTTFLTALNRFGGYGEFAGLLVDLTSLGSQISRLLNEGYKLTILAPDDKAWTHALTDAQLNSQTAVETILHYHIIDEYQTEESLYSTLRRMGKTSFGTLMFPQKLAAREVDGQVVFGEGVMEAGVWDHDIYADGRISVQGINKVLIPPGLAEKNATTSTTVVKPGQKPRSLFEILRLPVGSGGPSRSVRGSPVFAAAAAFLVAIVTSFWL